MSGCVDECPLEAAQVDERSVGPVEDNELVFRAAYSPAHFKKGKLQNAIIRASDLFDGTLSIWRVSEKSKLSPGDAVQICRDYAPEGNTLEQVRGVIVGELRAATRPEIEGRLYCVVDETDTDEEDGTHPAHAHIRICHNVMEGIQSREDETFQIVRSHLAFLFRRPTAQFYPVP